MEFDISSAVKTMKQPSVETYKKLKCGEITLNNNRKISFTCHFCAREVHSIGNFLRHILKEHLTFSKAEIDDLLLRAKSKQAMISDLGASAETMQQNDEQGENFIVETGSLNKNEQINFDSNKFMDSSDYNTSKMEHNEDFTYDSSLTDSQIEKSYEEFELLEEYFEAVPTISKEEIETREANFEIEVLPYSTIYRHQERNKSMIEPKIKPIRTNSTHETHAKNATQATSAMQITNITHATTTRQATNASPLKTEIQAANKLQLKNATVTTPATNVTQATNATQRQTTAEKNTRIMCQICKKIFKNEDLLSVHLLRHAEVKVKPFICEYCDALFSHKSNLNVHVKRHLGIKPYRCSFCDKSFTSSTELNLHLIKHTGSKLFKCHVCNKKFSRQFQLNAHSRRHYNERPYECRTCNSTFFDSRQLREHETIHSVDRPFSCESCGATFKRGKALREHKKLHLAEKSYECKICGKTFAQYSGLYAHVKIHNSKKD